MLSDGAGARGRHRKSVPWSLLPPGMWICGHVPFGGDFVFVGYDRYWKNIAAHKVAEFKVKASTTGRSDRDDLRVLSRIIKWATDGIRYESDDHHAERLIVEAGLTPQHTVVTPAIRDSRKARKVDQETPQGSDELPTSGGGQPSAGSLAPLGAGVGQCSTGRGGPRRSSVTSPEATPTALSQCPARERRSSGGWWRPGAFWAAAAQACSSPPRTRPDTWKMEQVMQNPIYLRTWREPYE